jgi:hypothetical protein
MLVNGELTNFHVDKEYLYDYIPYHGIPARSSVMLIVYSCAIEVEIMSNTRVEGIAYRVKLNDICLPS